MLSTDPTKDTCVRRYVRTSVRNNSCLPYVRSFVCSFVRGWCASVASHRAGITETRSMDGNRRTETDTRTPTHAAPAQALSFVHSSMYVGVLLSVMRPLDRPRPSIIRCFVPQVTTNISFLVRRRSHTKRTSASDIWVDYVHDIQTKGHSTNKSSESEEHSGSIRHRTVIGSQALRTLSVMHKFTLERLFEMCIGLRKPTTHHHQLQ